MAPIRATDAPGQLVKPPTEEIFPGGGPGEPWIPEHEGDALEAEYDAGGCFVVADGGGWLRASLDGGPAAELRPSAAALLPVAEHPRSERHRLRLEAGGGARVWALSFAPGVP